MTQTRSMVRWPELGAALLVFLFAGLACDEEEGATYEAELLAPPLVPERVVRDPGRVVVDLEVVEKEVEIGPRGDVPGMDLQRDGAGADDPGPGGRHS